MGAPALQGYILMECYKLRLNKQFEWLCASYFINNSLAKWAEKQRSFLTSPPYSRVPKINTMH